MIVDPERYANEYELDAKVDIDSKRESGSVPIVAMRLWLRAAHAVVELTGPTDGDGKTFGSDGNVSLWLHKSDLALGNVLLDRISSENARLREQVDAAHMSRLLTENENESLRELVAKYSAAAKYLCGFSHCNECNLDCASVFGDVPSGWDCARMLLDKKARELGVEVDE